MIFKGTAADFRNFSLLSSFFHPAADICPAVVQEDEDAERAGRRGRRSGQDVAAGVAADVVEDLLAQDVVVAALLHAAVEMAAVRRLEHGVDGSHVAGTERDFAAARDLALARWRRVFAPARERDGRRPSRP